MNQTSTEAYLQIIQSGVLSRLQSEVFTAIVRHTSPATANEIAEGMAHRINAINPRFAELEAMKAIRSCAPRACKVTGKNCVTWEATGYAPTPEDKRKTRRAERQTANNVLLFQLITLNIEVMRLREKVKNWGRPTNAKRIEKATKNRAQEFPFLSGSK